MSQFSFLEREWPAMFDFKTTEIYIKARPPDLVAPTSRPMVKQQVGDGK